MKTITVIGGAGYLGSVLCKELLEAGYKVKILDECIYGREYMEVLFSHPNFKHVLYRDMQDIKALDHIIPGSDAVIHLAAIVGDPSASLLPKLTTTVNYIVPKVITDLCKEYEVPKMLFASTCSVYGHNNKMLYPYSPLNPLSLYAKTKAKAERAIMDSATDKFDPTILRMGTLHGISPRMRFDLVVNTLTAQAMHEGTINLFGGEQFRAFCHVKDAARTYLYWLKYNAPLIANVVTENMSINELGQLIRHKIPEVEIEYTNVNDHRNYKVNCDTTRCLLRNYTSIEQTINDLIATKEQFKHFRDAKYSNVKTLRRLKCVY